MRKLILHGLVWLVLVGVFFAGVGQLLQRYAPMYSEKSIQQIKGLNPASKSIIFVGTSRVQRAVITDSLARFFPEHQVINAAMPGVGFIHVAFLIRYLNTLPGKKLFIVELSRDIKMENTATMFIINKLSIPNGYAIMAKENGLSTNPLFLWYWKLAFFFNLQLNKLDLLRNWLKQQYGYKLNSERPSFIGYKYTMVNKYKGLETLMSRGRLQSNASKQIDTSLKRMVDKLLSGENDSTRYCFYLPYISSGIDELHTTVPVFNTIDSLHAWHYTDADLASFQHKPYLMNVNHFNYRGAKVFTHWVNKQLQTCRALP